MVTLAALRDGDDLSFTGLQDLTELTPGNLITHLRKLEEAGYVVTEKKNGSGVTARTSVALTGGGRKALEKLHDGAAAAARLGLAELNLSRVPRRRRPAPGAGATAQRPPLLQASAPWLQPANRVVALATTWSEDRPGQSRLVERMPTTRTASMQTTTIMKIANVRRDGRSERTSAAGTASACSRALAERPKAANIDFSRGSAACRACSIWLRIICWRRGRLISLSSRARAATSS